MTEIGANGRSLAGGVAYKIEMFNGGMLVNDAFIVVNFLQGITSLAGAQLLFDDNGTIIGALGMLMQDGFTSAYFFDQLFLVIPTLLTKTLWFKQG
jgi:hypothetical protein